MNKVILQFWEESERSVGVRPFGCSIHIDNLSKEAFVSSVYADRHGKNFVPYQYDRIVGVSVEAAVSDVLFSKVKLQSSVRIYEHELSNLISMAEIIIRDDK